MSKVEITTDSETGFVQSLKLSLDNFVKIVDPTEPGVKIGDDDSGVKMTGQAFSMNGDDGEATEIMDDEAKKRLAALFK